MYYEIMICKLPLLVEFCVNNIIRHMLVSSCLIIALLFVGVSHADDGGHYSASNRDILADGEKMVLDAVVLRPIGLVTTVAGSVIYTISLPFSLLGGNEPAAREKLVKEPARYTFKRPLGDI